MLDDAVSDEGSENDGETVDKDDVLGCVVESVLAVLLLAILSTGDLKRNNNNNKNHITKDEKEPASKTKYLPHYDRFSSNLHRYNRKPVGVS